MTARTGADPVREILADLRREQIVAEARRVFGERGTTEVPMDEIAAAVGVARSTLYVYFPSRAELLVACIEDLYDQLGRSLATESKGSPPEQLDQLLAGLMATVDLQPAFFRLALAAQGLDGHTGDAVAERLAGIGVEITATLIEIVAAGNAQGLWWSSDLDRSVALIGQQIYGALAVRAADPSPPSPTSSAVELREFVMHGLRPALSEDGTLSGSQLRS